MTTRDWMFILLANTVLTLGGVGLYHYLSSDRLNRFGVVDLASVYREKEQQFSRLIAKEDATEEDRKKAVAAAQEFAQTLPAALTSLSNECGCVVLLGNAVASRTAQVQDLTPLLRAKVGM
jgi:hypothetical protein